MEKQRHAIIGIVLFLVLLILIIYIHRKRQHYKIEKEQAENNILFLKQLIVDNEKSLRSAIFEKFDFVKKIASLENCENNDLKAAEAKKYLKLLILN